MAGKDAIRVEGRVIGIADCGLRTADLPRKLLFTVELANGHRLLGHVPRRGREAAGKLGVGDKVMLEVSPFDLSRGCILGNGE